MERIKTKLIFIRISYKNNKINFVKDWAPNRLWTISLIVETPNSLNFESRLRKDLKDLTLEVCHIIEYCKTIKFYLKNVSSDTLEEYLCDNIKTVLGTNQFYFIIPDEIHKLRNEKRYIDLPLLPVKHAPTIKYQEEEADCFDYSNIW